MDFKKVPLRVDFILLIALVFGISSGILFTRIVSNHLFVKAYEEEVYEKEREEKLTKLNVPESYLPYYNLGNVAFEEGEYTSAIGYYTQALSLFPVGEKECDIRINLALAMCYGIDWDNMNSQEDIDTAILVLYKARDVLLENGWATEDGTDARDADAQQLKEDIDKMIEQLKNQKGDDSQDNQDQQDDKQDNQNQDDDGGGSDGSQSEKEKKLQKQLEEEKKNALEDRTEEQDQLRKWGKYNDEGDDESGDGGNEMGGTGGGGRTKPW